ncbi:MAG: class I adenylate-forming enzyme family protein [Planctomycetota bacterium]
MDSFNDCLQRWVQERGRSLAIWSRGENRRLTFSNILENRDRWRRLLPRNEALRPVVLATGNSTSFLELLLALRLDRVPVVLLEPGPSFEHLAQRCESLGVARLLHTFEPGDRLGDGVRWSMLDLDAEAEVPTGAEILKVTSGSSGDPAAFCFGERELLTGIRNIQQGMDLESSDRVLVTVPLSHSYGFDNGILSLLWIGTPLILEPDYFPAPLLKAMAEGETTVFPAAPPLVRALAACVWPASSPLRLVISAGAPLTAQAAESFHAASRRHVHQFYGSTETGGIAFETRPGSPEAIGTVGRPLPGVELAIDARERIWVSSEANRIGRLGQSDPDFSVVGTGDRGRLRPDGRLELIGRVGDVLNVGGRKVPAREIERALSRVPGIREVAIVGVDDPGRGDRIVAFVVGEASAEELRRLPRFYQPGAVHLLEALPHTERGKLDRDRLRTLAEASE